MLREGYANGKDGVRIHYRLLRQKGPWLVFLHGGTGTSASLLQQEEYFSKTGFSVLFIDFRGHGKSDRGRGKDFFRSENLVSDVFRVTEALSIPNAVLIGHCVGSFVAQEFA